MNVGIVGLSWSCSQARVLITLERFDEALEALKKVTLLHRCLNNQAIELPESCQEQKFQAQLL
eukprot:743859-Amphidinium_carterae.1